MMPEELYSRHTIRSRTAYPLVLELQRATGLSINGERRAESEGGGLEIGIAAEEPRQ